MRIGTIVKSKAGRDKDTFLVVISVDCKSVTVCDGKKRPLENAKVKKKIHLATTNTVLGNESLLTNKQIRTALRNYKADLPEVSKCQNKT